MPLARTKTLPDYNSKLYEDWMQMMHRSNLALRNSLMLVS